MVALNTLSFLCMFLFFGGGTNDSNLGYDLLVEVGE